jgi:hypothetical protein
VCRTALYGSGARQARTHRLPPTEPYSSASWQPWGRRSYGAPGRLTIRFFAWLAIHRRWRAERRFKHGMQDDASCSLCCQEMETLDHLLLAYAFSRDVWFQVLRRYGWELQAPTVDDRFVHWWIRVRKLVPKARRKGFDSLVLVVAWTIWLERNTCTFRMRSLQ